MKHKFDEFAYLYLNDELTQEEKIEFENLIAEDENLNNEFELIKKFNSAVNSSKRVEVSDKLLSDARRDLRIKIGELQNESDTKTSFINLILGLFTNRYAPAYSAAFSLFAGLLIGYLVFSTNPNDVNNLPGFELDDALSQNYKISNIQFLEEETANNNLTVQFEAVRPVVVNGSISDPLIKRLLAAAIINSDNAGLKMRSINKLSEGENSSLINDPKIKEALITAVKTDPNPGVRKEALSSLSKLKYDNQIRDAVLFVISNDTNSGLRISAINFLSQLKLEGISLDQEVYDNLSNHIQNEESDYIRLRTTALLGE